MPDFFIKFLTDEGDLIVDPSWIEYDWNGRRGLRRRWIAVDEVQEYLEASKFRFSEVETPSTNGREG